MSYWKCSPNRALKKSRQIKGIHLVGGFTVAIGFIALTVAIMMTTMANVSFIINTSPIFCIILDRFVLKESIPIKNIILVIVGLISVGIILIGDTSAHPEHMVGNLVALINPIAWACYWAINRKESKIEPDDSNPELLNRFDKILIYQNFSMIFLIAAGLIGGFHPETVQPTDLWIYSTAYMISQPGAMILFSVAPIFIPTSQMGCVKMLETIIFPLGIYAYAGEIPSLATFIGGAFLVTTLFVHTCITIREEVKGQNSTSKDENATSKDQNSEITNAV